ncbi:MAG: DUF998 domain-containing protein [Pacificimonas sp.]|jgi:hypothetical protein|nr:DUF998 domain-containing protein [Pacificimonas sp.]
MRALSYLIIGLTILAVLGDVAAILSVDNYSPVRDTISELAAVDGSRFEDPAILALALALFLTMVLLAVRKGGGAKWLTGLGFLLLCSIVVALMALWNAYDAPGGAMREGSFALSAHRKLVWILGGAFFGAATLLADRLKAIGAPWREKASLGLAFLWLVTAPIFFFVDTGIDGAYERGLALIVIAWLWIAATASADRRVT